jgi:hypothetical protein
VVLSLLIMLTKLMLSRKISKSESLSRKTLKRWQSRFALLLLSLVKRLKKDACIIALRLILRVTQTRSLKLTDLWLLLVIILRLLMLPSHPILFGKTSNSLQMLSGATSSLPISLFSWLCVECSSFSRCWSTNLARMPSNIPRLFLAGLSIHCLELLIPRLD